MFADYLACSAPVSGVNPEAVGSRSLFVGCEFGKGTIMHVASMSLCMAMSLVKARVFDCKMC